MIARNGGYTYRMIRINLKIITIMTVMTLILSLLVVITVLSAPVIITGDSTGSWSDSFGDDTGIDDFDNVTVENGNVKLTHYTPFNGTNWTKHGVVLDNGGLYDLYWAGNSHILKEEGTYKMWYDGYNGTNRRILYATSNDGINWIKSSYSPVIDIGQPGDDDDVNVIVPAVIKEAGTYKMWYAGYDGSVYRIMYATSPDGINWSKHSTVLTGQSVIPGTVMKEAGMFKMWYHDFAGGNWRIYYANSTDGTNWTKNGMVLDIGTGSDLDNTHVNAATVIKENDNLYRMWYTGHDGVIGYRIFYAVSDNETNWTKQGLAIDLGNPGEKDSNTISSSGLLKDDDGFYKLWYNGRDASGDIRVMYATTPYPFTNGVITSIKISLPLGQMWDRLEINKTEPGVGNCLSVSIVDGETNETIAVFENLVDVSINISSLDFVSHPTIKLFAFFIGNGSSSPILHDWKITWLNVTNQPPIADAGGDIIVNESDFVQLDGRGSYDLDGTIITYEWDFDAWNGLWWDIGAEPDANGPTLTNIYGDNGEFIVTLRVIDDQGASAQDTCSITVLNIKPSVSIESALMNVEIGLRVAGRKYNDVGMKLYEDGNPICYISIERMPGSPSVQMVWIPISINFSKSYIATVTYTPENPLNIGSNPVWIYIKSQNGKFKKIHHTFNVQQSIKRDSEHWNHVEPWEVDLRGYFVGLSFEITSYIIDPGSDDETMTFTYGSQVKTVIYLNNPPNPDPYPSPEYLPRDIIDVTTVIYEGPGNIALSVEDDDAGTTFINVEI